MKKETYESLEQFLYRIAQPVDRNICKDEESKTGKESFCGSSSLEESIQIARDGKDVESVLLGIDSICGNGNEISSVYDVAGGCVDIGSYLTNDPCCMIDFVSQNNQRMVDVYIDPCENGGVGSDVFRNKSIVAASLVDKLESDGYRCRVVVMLRVDASRANKGIYYAEICIKNYHQNLSIGQIVGCCSQSFFRRIGFAWIERMFAEDECNASDYGYGRSYPLKDNEIDNNTIVVSNTNSGGIYNSIDDAKQSVTKLINNYKLKNS